MDSLELGATAELRVLVRGYKGQDGLDVRKFYNGKPTKKGAFLCIPGQAEFAVKALGLVLAGESAEEALPIDRAAKGTTNLVVRRFEFKGMDGISIRKEGERWGKGIWLKLAQAEWAFGAMKAALAGK